MAGKESQLPSVEARGEIKKFSFEQRAILEKRGYRIYFLTGQSIKSLQESGRKFCSTWHKDYPDFEALASIRIEVAINPNHLFLPRSNRKTLIEQEAMIEKFSKRLGRKIKGVKAIIGEVPDYVELVFLHFEATDECLFGPKYNYDYARTKTPTPLGAGVADVGYFVGDGLGVSCWEREGGLGNVWAAPLVVPA
ncbi:MAG TPA: hypothetical protein VMX76_03090 [Nevskiaceae bacterium]|nr:hypothetical protein [Nevskiaceae bacterium]